MCFDDPVMGRNRILAPCSKELTWIKGRSGREVVRTMREI